MSEKNDAASGGAGGGENKGGVGKKILFILVALIVGFVGVGFILPGEFGVERSIVIEADLARVHALVGDLEQWPEWQPWTDEDPTIAVTMGEKKTGVGAHQSWTGDSGSGELTFTSSDPAKGIAYDMIFDGSSKSVGAMTYAAEGDGTKVTWSMSGDVGLNPVARYFMLMIDGMIGPMFENGLTKLKKAAEAAPADAGATDPGGDEGASDEG